MSGWLPEQFPVDEKGVERVTQGVRRRIARRRKVNRWARIASGPAVVLLLAIALAPQLLDRSEPLEPPAVSIGEGLSPSGRGLLTPMVYPPQEGSPPVGQVPPPAVGEGLSPRGRGLLTPMVYPPQAGSPPMGQAPASAKSRKGSSTPASPALSLARQNGSVALRWDGADDAEYLVYKCATPTFEACSLADQVKGTSWVDHGLDSTAGSGTITYYQVVPRRG